MPEIFQNIHWIDVLFVILLMGICYKGSRVGVGGQIIALTCWIVLVFVSIGYYKALSEAVFGFLLQKWARPLSFICISSALYILIKALEMTFNISPAEELSPIERVLGAGIAALRGFMFCGIVTILVILSPLYGIREMVTRESKTAMFFMETNVEIYSKMAKLFGLTKDDRKEEVMNDILTSAL
ncbi:MAG: CvpA family protein [Candidatus Omnitrophota bacterium]